MWFQFQNGTIKRNIVCFAERGALKFQFQNGTIKSELGSGGLSYTCSFQFQNGTIKRQNTVRKYNHIICFNSKMVRLKALNLPILMRKR